MVLKKNEKYNLIGKTTIQNIWTRHVIDSLQLSQYIDVNCENIFDFGSGAGFPSIVLSIVTEKPIFLIEKSLVKANFLKNVINELKLNSYVINDVLTKQNLSSFLQKNSVIVSRAFKSVLEILNIVNNNLDVTKILLLKGQKWKEEIQKAQKLIDNQWILDVKNSVLNEGVVLIMKKRSSSENLNK